MRLHLVELDGACKCHYIQVDTYYSELIVSVFRECGAPTSCETEMETGGKLLAKFDLRISLFAQRE